MKNPVKSLIAVAIAGSLVPAVSMGAAHAEKKPGKASIKLSGQISRAITFADNGVNDDVLFVDNNSSGTRLRVTGDTDLGGGNKAGIYWETQYQDNNSSSLDINGADTSSAFTSRIRELWFSGAWGKLYLGQGNGAANGTAEVDLSGTFIADYSGNNLDDAFTFRVDDGSADGAEGPRHNQAFTNFDGLSRNDRLRYDTPALGPVVLSADVGQEKFELAARVKQDLAGGGKFQAAFGYVDTEDEGVGGFDGDQWDVSASVLLGFGLNFTAAYGERNVDGASGDDPTMLYLKIGYKAGNNYLSGSYQIVEDLNAQGDEATRYGLQYLYHLPQYGVELFVAGSINELDRPGTNFEDITLFHVGSRIKF